MKLSEDVGKNIGRTSLNIVVSFWLVYFSFHLLLLLAWQEGSFPNSGIRATVIDRGWFVMASSSASQYRVEQFDGKNNFTLWQRRVKDILVQQGLAKPLKGEDGKPEKMKPEDWEELESRCVSVIRLFIADNIINNVNDVDSAPKLWERI